MDTGCLAHEYDVKETQFLGFSMGDGFELAGVVRPSRNLRSTLPRRECHLVQTCKRVLLENHSGVGRGSDVFEAEFGDFAALERAGHEA